VRLLALAAAVLAVASCDCGACDAGPPAELRVAGVHPYVRCLAADPPEARDFRVGDLRLAIEGRRLTVGGVPSPLRVAAFSGPAPAQRIPARTLAGLRERGVSLVIVLGGLGDDAATARRTLGALADAGLPVLVLAGGRDDAGDLDAAFDALDEEQEDVVLDARALRVVDLGADELVLVSGAPAGRYARSNTACGFAERDLDDVAADIGDRGRARRWLVSWAAPAGGVAAGLEGADAGDPGLAALAERLGVRGGIHAWPDTRAAELAGDPPASIVVLPIAGPAVERADGSRLMPAATVLDLGGGGLSLPLAP